MSVTVQLEDSAVRSEFTFRRGTSAGIHQGGRVLNKDHH
jgi:hypothetical protein